MNKDHLTKEEYEITQQGKTEMPFQNKYWNVHEDGVYHCKVCDNALFSSTTKFDSGTGWPSFDSAIPNAVEMVHDDSLSMSRVEVICSECKAHLGHVFSDGPKETTGQRFCMNSASLDLK